MAGDPARAKPRTFEEAVKEAQQACIKTPCFSAGTVKCCPFCPTTAKRIREEKKCALGVNTQS